LRREVARFGLKVWSAMGAQFRSVNVIGCIA